MRDPHRWEHVLTVAKVREWADKARHATTRRDRWICALHDEGASYRDIGKAAGMSHTAIQRVVARRPMAEESPAGHEDQTT